MKNQKVGTVHGLVLDSESKALHLAADATAGKQHSFENYKTIECSIHLAAGRERETYVKYLILSQPCRLFEVDINVSAS